MSKKIGNNFVVTAQGFVKEVTWNTEPGNPPTVEVQFTHLLREAKACSAKEAKTLLEKCKLTGFVYNPHIEAPMGEKRFAVERRSSFNSFSSGTLSKGSDHTVLEYESRKRYGPVTDVLYLNERLRPPVVLYTEAEAQQVAIDLNEKMAEELNRKITAQKVKLNEKRFDKFGI